jgi:tRNA (guanine-N7-)-methyltransferase
VGKNKLARWAEIGTFKNVIQPESGIIPGEDHPIKGAWNEKIFCNQYPIVLELGCGKGEYTIGLSSRFPNRNFIGIDIKGARIWRGAKTAHEKLISNVAFLRTRIEFINSFFAEDEVDEIWITFPDPYNGKRNSNKRLTCPWFLNNYRKFVKNRGIIHLKTDNAELHKYTRSVVKMNDLEILRDTSDLYAEPDSDGILSIRTHYENIFLKEGLTIKYLSFRLDKNRIIEDEISQSKKK